MRGIFNRLAQFFRRPKPAPAAVNAPSKPSAHNPAGSRLFAPVKSGSLRSSLLALRVESTNPIFVPHSRYRPAACRGRSNRRKAQRLHRATR